MQMNGTYWSCGGFGFRKPYMDYSMLEQSHEEYVCENWIKIKEGWGCIGNRGHKMNKVTEK